MSRFIEVASRVLLIHFIDFIDEVLNEPHTD